VKGIRPIKYHGGNDLAYYTYLKHVRYQVRAHFEWNDNRPELAGDRKENKHHNIARRMIERGGRRDILLGTRECQGYVEPSPCCERSVASDDISQLGFSLMYRCLSYPYEAYSSETRSSLSVSSCYPVMTPGMLTWPRPEGRPLHGSPREMAM